VLIGAFLALSGISAAVMTATSAASNVAAGAAAGAGAAADEGLDPNGLLIDRFLRSDTTTDPAPAATRDEVGRVIASSLDTGTLADADKQYLGRTIAARTGLDEAQAAEAEARQAAETARKIGMVAAFITAASLLVSAVGAYFGATLGGNHRDKQTFFTDWVKPW
jgi:hypothetical protein